MDTAGRKRSPLHRLALAASAALVIPALYSPPDLLSYLNFGNDYNGADAALRRNLRHNQRAMADDLVVDDHAEDELNRHRILSADASSDEDYAELEMPGWLKMRTTGRTLLDGEDEVDVSADLASVMHDMKSSFVPLTHGGDSMAAYTLEDLVETSKNYHNTYAIMVYDPASDEFLFVYDTGRMQWVSAVTKLRASFEVFSHMLRKSFPDRFRGAKSDELALAIGSADYPHLSAKCLSTFPHPNENCPRHDTPVLQFGSAFRSAEILPNMIPMPMPDKHSLTCFKIYTEKGVVCSGLRPNVPVEGPNGLEKSPITNRWGQNGELVFGEEFGLEFDDLIPQLVWRGTDFSYLAHDNSLDHGYISVNETSNEVTVDVTERHGRKSMDVKNSFPVANRDDVTDDDTKKKAGTDALLSAFDKLFPRWKAVALTASAEREAEVLRKLTGEDEIPWADMRFSKVSPHPDMSKEVVETMYKLFEEYGVSPNGGYVSLAEQAKYKYHIDLGGGGGTTWSGTLEKLALPGLLFHHCTPTKDYIHDRMMPWVHYVPVAPDLSDLREKFDWAEANPAAAKLIANQATELMREIGSNAGFAKLYDDHFLAPLRAVMDAYQPVSAVRPDVASWRDVLKEYEGVGDKHHFNPAWHCNGKGSNACTLTKQDCSNAGESCL